MSGHGRQPDYASPEGNGELKKAPSPDKKDLLRKPRERRPMKPDYYDFTEAELAVPYIIESDEPYLTRAGIADRQLRPPTSKLLVPVMKYNPARPREVLWEAHNRREQAPREVVIHPVKDLDYYKLRNCITCVQREKQLKAEREADPYAPHFSEYLVRDVVEGLMMLNHKVRSFHQEHMFVGNFLNMYNHFGNINYVAYDIETTQEELRKFSRLMNCHSETMKCLEMFCTREQLDGFWRNSGLTSIYEASRGQISRGLKEKIAEEAALAKEAALANAAAGLDTGSSDSDDTSSDDSQ